MATTSHDLVRVIPHAVHAVNDLGMIPRDSSSGAATTNRVNLQAALDAMHWAGDFTLPNPNGFRGPILYPIVFPADTFYFKRDSASYYTLRTPLTSGCSLIGVDDGYPLGDGDFGPGGTGGSCTRFVETNPSDTAHFLLVRNAGFGAYGIAIFGRPVPNNIHSGTGDRMLTGIALEGRGAPYLASGKLHVDELMLTDFENAIHFMDGYYDTNDVFQSGDPQHADETFWGHVTVYNCGSAVLSDNAQACWHHFAHMNVIGGHDPTNIILNCVSGGLYKFDFLTVGVPYTTVLVVRNRSQNTSRFDIHVLRDHFDEVVNPVQKITLLQFDASGGNTPDWYKFINARFTGHFSDLPYALGSVPGFEIYGHPWDSADLLVLNGLPIDPSGRYGTSIEIDIANCPPEVAAPFYKGGGMQITVEDRDLINSEHLWDGLTIMNMGAGQPGVGPPVGPGTPQMWRATDDAWHNMTTS